MDDFIKFNETSLFSDFAELIAIPSVRSEADGNFTFGKNCGLALDKALELGRKYGFEAENHDYYCGSIIYKSIESEEEIGIVTHLDIVPVGDGWKFQPFKLTEKDGLFIGRGTEDDKGPMIAALYAMRYLKENDIKLPFSVRLIMGSDEEVGMTDLPHFLETKKPPRFSFTPDSEYPVCIGEKGIAGCDITLGSIGKVIADIKGGNATNAVPDSAYAVINTEICFGNKDNIKVERLSSTQIKVTAAGRAAHAAYPEGSVNAIAVLTDWIIKNIEFEKVSKEYVSLEYLSAILSEFEGKNLGIDMSDEESGYLTCIGGVMKIVEGRIVQNINIRYPVTKKMDDVFALLSRSVIKDGFSVSLLYDKPPYYKNPDSKEIQALMQAYRDVTGRTDVPYTTGGGTYARAFPDCVAFGATFGDVAGLLGDGRGGPHERDEYITKEELFDSIKIFASSMINLAE